ncbi:MAG: TIGR03617 family F420-dependent LLM class oxidoreductase [Acidimicrobiales bacterium]
MHIDVMTGGGQWKPMADYARSLQDAGFSGMLFTETSKTPWMAITAAAMAAEELTFTTGIAVAFPRSPMVSAALAWELAENTGGRFRLGLGSQVKAHVERRYGVEFAPPGPRMRDYLLAVQACLSAFRRESKLDYQGDYYQLSLLPEAWTPPNHDFGDIKVDVSAVGPYMTRMAGEVADGIHVHPLHSVPYLNDVLLPKVAEGAERAGRPASAVDLIIPVFTVVGDTPEEQAATRAQAKSQIAFYGSTKNYGFQFDMLGFEGTSAKLNERLKAGDIAGMADLITDDMLEYFAVTASWADLGPKLVERYEGLSERLVMYQAEATIKADPSTLPKWAKVAEAVRAA